MSSSLNDSSSSSSKSCFKSIDIFNRDLTCIKKFPMRIKLNCNFKNHYNDNITFVNGSISLIFTASEINERDKKIEVDKIDRLKDLVCIIEKNKK